jgi:cytochrome P450
MKAGDMVILPPLHGLDEREFQDPLTVDFNRAAAPHSTFGNGVHRCPGAHLSQVEMEIVLREWLARIPEFEIDPERPPTMRSGILGAMLQVGLRWNPDATAAVPLT